MPCQKRGSDQPKAPTNIIEYVRSKTARANTGLIGGMIYYDGMFWDEDEYNATFPPPKLKFDTVQLDGRQLEQ